MSNRPVMRDAVAENPDYVDPFYEWIDTLYEYTDSAGYEQSQPTSFYQEIAMDPWLGRNITIFSGPVHYKHFGFAMLRGNPPPISNMDKVTKLDETD